MLPRQFSQLASMSRTKRDPMLAEGLVAIGENVISLASDIEKCREGDACRAASITRNVVREEAGKFLILMDIFRTPSTKQALVSVQLKRATNHLAKLIYEQIADYSIGDQAELLRAIEIHRKSLHLDGPNDVDWIFRNRLIDERERALYVDLVDSEGELLWWTPDPVSIRSPSRAATLVSGILECGLVSEAGFRALQTAWEGFDPTANTHCGEWSARTARALALVEPSEGRDEQGQHMASFVANRWPMPMAELQVEELKIDPADLIAARESWWNEQFGPYT